MSERLTEFSDRRVWNLSNYLLEQMILDYAVTLLFARSEGAVTIVIEQTFELRIGWHTEKITPGEAGTVAPLLACLHKPVASMTAFRNGDLLVLFADGATISVSKYDHNETWNSYCSGEITGANMLCSPHPGFPWGG